MICCNCDKTDGLVYTSLPPKVRCEISKRFHEMGDECEFEWKPIIHGRWTYERFTNTNGGSYSVVWCSNCQAHMPWVTKYCPNCGAKMDEVEHGDISSKL